MSVKSTVVFSVFAVLLQLLLNGHSISFANAKPSPKLSYDEGKDPDDYLLKFYTAAAAHLANNKKDNSLVMNNTNVVLTHNFKGKVTIGNIVDVENGGGISKIEPEIFSSISNSHVLVSDSDVKINIGTKYTQRNNIIRNDKFI